MGEKGRSTMKEIIKNTFKKHSWFIVGLPVCFTIIDLIMKKGFSISDFLIRIIVIIVLYFITEAMEYSNKKK
jgi:hypothetical protein